MFGLTFKSKDFTASLSIFNVYLSIMKMSMIDFVLDFVTFFAFLGTRSIA